MDEAAERGPGCLLRCLSAWQTESWKGLTRIDGVGRL